MKWLHKLTARLQALFRRERILQDIDEAYRHAKREYKKRPQNIDVCKTMAKIHYKQNDLEEANKLIEVASRTNKQDAEIFCLKGLIDYKLGNTKDGIQLMKVAMKINPFLSEDLLQEMKVVSKEEISSLY